MVRARLLFALVLALLVAAAVPFRALSARAAGKPLLVIMTANARIKDVGSSTLRRVFQGLPTNFEAGKRFIPVNHPIGSATRIQFDRAVLALEPEQVGAFWIDRRIRDEGLPPRTVSSAALALRVAASLPGAITYGVPELLDTSLRALTVDGKAATHPEYPLK